MSNLFNKKSLIVCKNYSYYPFLFKFKNTHPEFDIKIIDRNSLIDKVSYRFKKDPIPYLMVEESIEYSKAKKYVELLRVCDASKNEKLNNLMSHLSNNDYLTKDEYGLFELKQYENIYLFNMSNDNEVINLLSRNDITVKCISFSDLEIEGNKWPEIIYFQNKFLQYFYIFSDIRRLIEEKPECKDNITLLIDDGDEFHVQVVADIFDIPYYTNLSRSLITEPKIKEKLGMFLANKNFDFEYEESDEALSTLSSLINKYRLKEIKEFDEAYSNLLEIVSSFNISEVTNKSGIAVTSKFNFDPNQIIYVTNFRHGSFYKEFSDSNVLTDKELEEVGANPSYVLTKLDKEAKLGYLKYNNIMMLSRVKQHQSDSIYDSQFIEEFGLKKSIKQEQYNVNGKYTDKAYQIVTCDQYDKAFLRTAYEKKYVDSVYDHSFKGINGTTYVPHNGFWSATKLERYVLCPFQFYLDKIIPCENDKHAAYRGTLLHKVLESVYRSSFDFEKSFEQGVKAYKEQTERENVPFTSKEEVYIEIIHYWAKRIIPAIRKQVNEGANVIYNDRDAEIKFTYTLRDEFGNKYPFTGSIDKVLWTEFNGHKYYTIVDYKSGAERFSPASVCVGGSTQLPLYYYASINSNKADQISNNFTFGGVVIKPMNFPSLKAAFVEKDNASISNTLKGLRMVGITRNDNDYFKSIDNTAFTDKGNLKSYGGTYLRKTDETFGEVDAKESIVPNNFGSYNFNDLIEDAIKSSIDAIKKINSNEYPIKPTSFNLAKFDQNRLACSYCGYRDVCYRKLQDAKDYSEDIKEHFFPTNEVEENDEERFEGGEA